MIDAMQWFQLNGKKAMVTGGAAGLCYAMAEGLHLAGAEAVLVDRSPAVGEAAARLGAQWGPGPRGPGGPEPLGGHPRPL